MNNFNGAYYNYYLKKKQTNGILLKPSTIKKVTYYWILGTHLRLWYNHLTKKIILF